MRHAQKPAPETDCGLFFNMDHTEELNRKIQEYRSAVIDRRARAFVDCPDYALGLELKPLTPKTWTMLHATGNRLICGGQPLEGDLRNYIWFHSENYTIGGRFAKLRKWSALLRFNIMLRRRQSSDWYVACLALMGTELARIINDTLADAPKGGNPTSPGPCMEAQFIGLFAKEYGWNPEYTREQPLRKLFQLRRNFDQSDDDDGERAIRFNHLRQRNAGKLKTEEKANADIR